MINNYLEQAYTLVLLVCIFFVLIVLLHAIFK